MNKFIGKRNLLGPLIADKVGIWSIADITQMRHYNFIRDSSYTQAQGTVSGYTSGGVGGLPIIIQNVIDKFPFATNANATDVGDLTQARFDPAGQSSNISGYTSGGGPSVVNTIDKFPFASNANATDVGDLTEARSGSAGQQV
jgi:hypothetical protein